MWGRGEWVGRDKGYVLHTCGFHGNLYGHHLMNEDLVVFKLSFG